MVYHSVWNGQRVIYQGCVEGKRDGLPLCSKGTRVIYCRYVEEKRGELP